MASTIPIIAGVAIVLSTSHGSLAQTSAAAPRPAAQDSDFSERARQDREIVYFLHAPETHSFSLYHAVTIKDVGRSTYVNVVRAGSKVSNPSAVCLDTGEALKVETLKGDEITKAKIDIGEPVKPESEAVVVRFTPVAAGTTTRIRIRETYTDPARYRLEGDQLVWDRSFGRPQNAGGLPGGWALEGSAFPAPIPLTDDHRIRLAFTNPRLAGTAFGSIAYPRGPHAFYRWRTSSPSSIV